MPPEKHWKPSGYPAAWHCAFVVHSVTHLPVCVLQAFPWAAQESPEALQETEAAQIGFEYDGFGTSGYALSSQLHQALP